MKKFTFLFILTLLPLWVSAYDAYIDGIYYDLDNTAETASVTSSSNKYEGNIVIPESVVYKDNSYAVTSIGDYAFKYCSNLTSVTIPNSVTTIGEYALYVCKSLTSITIPNSVTSIGEYAFSGCSGLTSITIPNSVTSIGCGAFYDTGWYNTQPSGLLYLDNWLLGYKDSIPTGSIAIKDGTKGIASWAFLGCSDLASINIPNSVTSIGSGAFSGCSGLTSITIPNSITSIGECAFYGCSGLTTVTIPNSVTSIGYKAFYGCSGLTSITIPNSVTSIGYGAFECCSNLYSVSINTSSIGSWFSKITSLKEVTLGDSVTSIGDYAFYGCSNLTSITIPNSVTSIGRSAFQECSGLESVTINTSSIGSWFSKITSLKEVILGDRVSSIGNYVFADCYNLISIKVESGNSVYDSRNDCNGIIKTENNELILGCKNTIIPNSVTSIGEHAFSGCSGLTSITIPNSVTSIKGGAFSYCSGLASIKVESGNNVYDSRNNCNGIIKTETNELILGCKNTIIPNSVTSIGSGAFSGCSGLTSVTIPNSVTSIGSSAFSGCDSLSSIIIEQASPKFSYYGYSFPFKNLYESATLYVPTGRTQIYKDALGWGLFKTIREMDMEGIEYPVSPYENLDNRQMIFGYLRQTSYDFKNDFPEQLAVGGKNAGLYKACVAFDANQIAPIKGNNIVNIRFGLLNTDIHDVKVWIGSTRDKQDLCLQSVPIIQQGWNEVELLHPCKVEGDSIFIGFEYIQDDKNYPCARNRSSCNSSSSASFLIYGPYGSLMNVNQWLNGKDDVLIEAALAIQCIVEGNSIPLYDIRTESLTLYSNEDYVNKSASLYLYKGISIYPEIGIVNWGKRQVENLTISVELDGEELYRVSKKMSYIGKEIIRIYTNSNLNPVSNDLSVGKHKIKVCVTEIEGQKPEFPNDDEQIITVGYYTNDMGRDKHLVEINTQTGCPPGGTYAPFIDEVLRNRNDVVLVRNHLNDNLSCEASNSRAWFSDWLAFPFVNRSTRSFNNHSGSLSSCGLSNDMSSLTKELSKHFPSLAKVTPEASFDASSRQLTINVSGRKNNEFIPLEGYSHLYVLLTEDSIINPQIIEGGKIVYDFVHNGVLRTSVSAIWGDPIQWNGDEFNATYTVRLEDDWVKDNMHVVAFIAKPFTGSNFEDIYVVNCNDFALKDAAATSVIDKKEDNIHINVVGKRIVVSGIYDSVQVYNTSGVVVANNNLPSGTYIVKVKSKAGITTKKVTI